MAKKKTTKARPKARKPEPVRAVGRICMTVVRDGHRRTECRNLSPKEAQRLVDDARMRTIKAVRALGIFMKGR